jgi:hypothetical protein
LTRACRQPVQTLPGRSRTGGQSYGASAGEPFFCRRDLLAQSKVLEGDLAVAADEEREEPEHVE